MKSFYCFFIVVFIGLVHSQQSPQIIFTRKTSITDIGGVLDLACSVTNPAEYLKSFPVMWFKVDREEINEPVLLSVKNKLVIRDTRFLIRHENDKYDTYILQINNIQETDDSLYQCKLLVSINSHYVIAENDLRVRRQPFILDNSTKSLVVYEGQPVNLECYAKGFPSPKISWRRLNTPNLPTGGAIYKGNILKIPAIKSIDRGVYRCVAENNFGKGDHHNVVVEVQFGPIITVRRPYVGQALTYEQELECHIEAFPSPAIVWLKNGIEIPRNKHYSILEIPTEDDIVDSKLKFSRVENWHYGNYTCKASNIFGTAEYTLTLFEQIMPVCPPACGKN